MKYLSLAIVACLAFASSSEAVAPFYSNIADSRTKPNSYIVILKNDTAFDTFQPRYQNMVKFMNASGRRRTKINFQFSVTPGFTADLDPVALKNILGMPEVAYVEQDSIMTIFGTQKTPPSWGIPRVSQRGIIQGARPSYKYPDSAGAGITAYVIDTGINVKHPDFQGRAVFGTSFIANGRTDDNGHGTHVAGTIGGKTFGVAKKVNLVGVKVLDFEGNGHTSDVIKGVDWAVKNAKDKKKRAVINMSVGGEGRSRALDDAISRAYKGNIPVFVAAGNRYGVDPCGWSPSGSPNAYTVGSTDIYDRVSEFSNLGKCVKIFAPGTNIVSAYYANKGSTIESGTSMATPHVAGVAALYMSADKNLKTAKKVYEKLTSTATKNAVKGDLKGSANLLVFNGGGK
ncbi:hypothetical protein BGX34_009257 [Mortierella sp. NVP85]|nr:hypothetical protein BGX34_009257 [Mortierella sp. NVP85]